MTNASRKVLAVASGGGHWEQLMLLRDTLDNYDVRFATTDPLIARGDIAGLQPEYAAKGCSLRSGCDQDRS